MDQEKSGVIWGKELRPSLHLGVVAYEKEAFVLPSTRIANFTFIYVYKTKVVDPSWRQQMSPRGLVANELDCDIVVTEFEFHSHFYVPFRTSTLEKGTNHL